MSNNNTIAFFIVVFIVATIIGTYFTISYIDRLTVSGKAAVGTGKVNITINGFCGDGLVLAADNETCESTNLNGETCVTLGFDSGTLSCATDCRSFVKSGCVAKAAESVAGAIPRPGVTEVPVKIIDIEKGFIYSIVVGKVYPVYIRYKGIIYQLNVEMSNVTLIINPGNIRIDFVKGLEYSIDLDKDGKDDVVMVLDEVLARRAVFRFWSIELRTPIKPLIEKPIKEEESKEEKPQARGIRLDKFLFVIFLIILTLSILIYRKLKH